MSTVKVDDIQEATSGGGKAFPIRAWCTFNQVSTQYIRDSFAVSSIVDETTATTSTNLTNTMAVTHYSVADTLSANFLGDTSGYIKSNSTPMDTGKVRTACGTEYEGTTSYADRQYVSIQVYGQ